MRNVTFILALLGVLALGTTSAVAADQSPHAVPLAVWTATATDHATITPVRWWGRGGWGYGYYGYPRYYGYAPYRYGWYAPRPYYSYYSAPSYGYYDYCYPYGTARRGGWWY